MTRETEVCEPTADRAPADRDERYADVDTDHLADVEDGCGCAEVWEHVSDARAQERGADGADAGADAGAD